MKRRDFLKKTIAGTGIFCLGVKEFEMPGYSVNPLTKLLRNIPSFDDLEKLVNNVTNELQTKLKEKGIDLKQAMRLVELRNKLIKDGYSQIKDGSDSKNIDSLFITNPNFEIIEVETKFRQSPERLVDYGFKTYDWYKQVIEFNNKIKRILEERPKYENHLAAAEKKYNVDRRIISALLAVESDLGNNLGGYDAFNALVSRYVLLNLENKRAQTRTQNNIYYQLTNLLQVCEKLKIPIYSYKSSYAGAGGAMQGMPDMVNLYFDGNDLKSIPDAINFIGNFIQNKYYRHDKENGIIEQAAWDRNEKIEDTIKNIIEYKSLKFQLGRDLSPSELKQDIKNKTNNRLAIEKYNPSDAFVRAVLEIAVISGFYYEYSKDPNMFRTKLSTQHQ